MTSARLFGGAALYIGTGEADVSQPLSPDRIKRSGVRHLTMLTKRKLTPGQISEDAESEYFGLPAYYEMQLTTGQALRIHPSRLVVLQGADLPDDYSD